MPMSILSGGIGWLEFAPLLLLRSVTGIELAILALLVGFDVIANLAPLTLPRGDRLSGDDALVVIALLTTGMLGALAVAAVGGVVFWLTAPPMNKTARFALQDAIRRTLLVVVSGSVRIAVGSALADVDPVTSASLSGLCAAVTFVTLDLMWEGLLAQLRRGSGIWKSGLGVLHSAGGAYMGQASIAVVAGVLLPSTGVWAVFILGALILAMRQSFASYLDIRRAYYQTILALARGAEIGGVSDSGRAERVADLSVAVGRKLGLKERQLEALNYAALLYDVGRLGEVEPSEIASSSRIVSSIAHQSARILEDIESLKETASIIRRCEDRYDPSCQSEDWEALAAQALGAAVEWDYLAVRNGDRPTPTSHALAFTSEVSGRLDPRVLDAMLSVVDRA